MLKQIVGVVALLVLAQFPANAGESYTERDNRQPIGVTSKERNQFLYTMREFMHDLFNVHHALARSDFQALATAARPLGQLLNRTPASLRERLPTEFTEISIALRESIEALIREAETRKDPSVILTQLAESLSYCSGCHDAYRLEVRNSSFWGN